MDFLDFFLSVQVEWAGTYLIQTNLLLYQPSALGSEPSRTLTFNIYQIAEPISADIPQLCIALSKHWLSAKAANSRLARLGLT